LENSKFSALKQIPKFILFAFQTHYGLDFSIPVWANGAHAKSRGTERYRKPNPC